MAKQSKGNKAQIRCWLSPLQAALRPSHLLALHSLVRRQVQRQLNTHFTQVMIKKGGRYLSKAKSEPNSIQILQNAGTLYLLGQYFISAIQLQNITMLVTNIVWFDGYK